MPLELAFLVLDVGLVNELVGGQVVQHIDQIGQSRIAELECARYGAQIIAPMILEGGEQGAQGVRRRGAGAVGGGLREMVVSDDLGVLGVVADDANALA